MVFATHGNAVENFVTAARWSTEKRRALRVFFSFSAMFLLETRPSIRALPCALPERHARARGGRRARVGRRSLGLGARVRRELGVRRGRASRGVRAADRFSLRPTRSSRVARAGTRGARRERSRRFSIRGRFGEARVRSARPQRMAPTVNDVSSPRFFTPLPFASGAAGPSGAAGAVPDDHHHPRGHAVAHGVKRDASQMMTVEERDERVRKIVSLVKVLLTGACGRDIARVSTRDARPSPIAQAAALGPRTVAFARFSESLCEKASARSTSINFFLPRTDPRRGRI